MIYTSACTCIVIMIVMIGAPLVRGPLFMYKLICPYVVLICNMLTYTSLSKDMYAYNEGTLTGGI